MSSIQRIVRHIDISYEYRDKYGRKSPIWCSYDYVVQSAPNRLKINLFFLVYKHAGKRFCQPLGQYIIKCIYFYKGRAKIYTTHKRSVNVCANHHRRRRRHHSACCSFLYIEHRAYLVCVYISPVIVHCSRLQEEQHYYHNIDTYINRTTHERRAADMYSHVNNIAICGHSLTFAFHLLAIVESDRSVHLLINLLLFK